MNLHKMVSLHVAKAIEGVERYKGEEKEQNVHNWTQISTDRIIQAFMEYLPDLIDIETKYETTEDGGIYIKLGHPEKEPEINDIQLKHLASFSRDQGWNEYNLSVLESLQTEYAMAAKVGECPSNQPDKDASSSPNTPA